MPSDLDVYRSASVLIDQHGADALVEAAQRTDAFWPRGISMATPFGRASRLQYNVSRPMNHWTARARTRPSYLSISLHRHDARMRQR